jgi:hypothetical protein
MNNGLSSDACFSWIVRFGEILAEKNMLLPEEWSIESSDNGSLYVHKGFSTIQNRWDELSGQDFPRTKPYPVDAEKVRSLCREYLNVQAKSRLSHRQIFDKAMETVPTPVSTIVQNTLDENFPNLYSQGAKNLRLFCIPSHMDDPSLWQNTFKIPSTCLSKIEPWAKMHEDGVLLASARYRSTSDGDQRDEMGQARGHDGLSWCAYDGYNAALNVWDIEKGLSEAADHEGQHYLIDLLCSRLLGISTDNTMYEGFTCARERMSHSKPYPDALAFDEYISAPGRRENHHTPEQNDRQRNANYVSGPRFYRALFLSCGGTSNPNPDEEVWAKIAAAMLEVACDMQTDVTEDQTQKLAHFHVSLMRKLGISIEQVRHYYNRDTRTTPTPV